MSLLHGTRCSEASLDNILCYNDTDICVDMHKMIERRQNGMILNVLKSYQIHFDGKSEGRILN